MPEPLAAPLALGERVSVARRILDFEPARDGFAFPNTFAWTADDLAHLADEIRPLTTGLAAAVPALAGALAGGRRGLAAGAAVGALGAALRLPDAALRGLARRWPSFGLCGGMALAAVERWPGAGGLPTCELERDRLRPLFRRRQAQTLRAAGLRFLRYWLGVRLHPGVETPFAADLAREVAAIRARLDGGRPVILGLVGDAPDPFTMHQVVVFGYEGEGEGGTRLLVYDPNSPGRARHVRVGAGPDARITTDLPTGPRPNGGYHISTRPGVLSMVFAVEV